MYKSKYRCTGMRDRITRDRETQRYAKTYFFFDLQARATSEIAVADLSELENEKHFELYNE